MGDEPELVEVAARFSHAFLRWLDGQGGAIAYPRLRVLEVLHCGGPTRMRDLAEVVGLSARNLTTLADGLEHDGLVRRTSHPTDRRATLLELTDEGMAAAECSLAPRRAELATLFDSLSPTARQQLGRSLATLLEAMG